MTREENPRFLGIGSKPARSQRRSRIAALLALVLGSPLAARAQLAVPFSTDASFPDTSQVASYVVDLGTLPLRPELIVDAIPLSAHPNLQIQIEIDQIQITSSGAGNYCPSPTTSIFSPPAVGNAQLVWQVWNCDAQTGALVGDTARVNVRVLDFGGVAAPASVRIALRGVTKVPTSTQKMTYWTPGIQHTVTLRPDRDTTIYERDPNGSNGAGDFLWAARDVLTTSPFTRHAVRSLVSFPLRDGVIPQNATIVSASLRLDVESIVGTGNALQVWAIPQEGQWDEGPADAAASELQAGATIYSAATWLTKRSSPVPAPWDVAGAEPFDLLASQAISTTGVKTLSSTALREYVEFIVNDASVLRYLDGFLLRGAETATTTSGLQIASRENDASGATPPELVVTFSVPAEAESSPANGTVTYINEGTNLRWIYDTDQDDVYTTSIGGVWTVTGPSPNAMPYSYRFTGTPGFTGRDCVSWYVDSAQTGTIGAGQLIQYHNVPTTDPPDTDRDGMFDICDNCPLKANGPLLGSCLSGPRLNQPCRSNRDCTTGTCSLSQEDANFDGTGDACVPEPGTTAMLVAGALALAGLGRRR